MDYTRGAVLDRNAFRLRAKNEPVPSEQGKVRPWRRCTSIAELEEELDILNRRMQGVQGRLDGFAANNATATRDGVIDAREEWESIKCQQWLREFELEEALEYGAVQPGSFERALARIDRMADIEEAEEERKRKARAEARRAREEDE